MREPTRIGAFRRQNQPPDTGPAWRAKGPPAVVHLDPDDDVGSIREKINHADGGRVILVVPRDVRVMRDPVRLKVLKRHAKYLAKDVAIIAEDGDARRAARQAGFTVGSSLKGVRFRESDPTAPSRAAIVWPKPSRAGLIAAGIAALLVVSVGVVGAAALAPSATVELAPVSVPATDTFTVRAGVTTRGINPDQRALPARRLTAELEATDSVPTSGRRTALGEPARGQVTMSNRSPNPVTAPAGAIVRTRGDERFRTDTELVLQPGQSGSVGVTAVRGGVSGNILANAIVDIVEPGTLASQVTVANPRPFTGGSQRETSYVELSDRSRARAAVAEKLRIDGYQRLFDNKRPSEQIFRDAVRVEVLPGERFQPSELEAEAAQLSFTARGRVSALAFDGADLMTLTRRMVAAQLPSHQQALPDTFQIVPLGFGAADDDSITFQIQVAYRVIPAVNVEELRSAIAGHAIAEATRDLTRVVPLAHPVRIALWPEFMPTLPYWPARIDVRLVSD